MFATYHANKRGITLDAGRIESVTYPAALAERSDVVVLSPSKRAPVAGLDLDEPWPRWRPDDGILACVTPFGLTGPWRDLRATAFTSFALGGGMHRAGPGDGTPVAMPGRLAWDEAGLRTAITIVAALHERAAGQRLIDVSVHEVATRKDFHFERFDAEGGEAAGRGTSIGIPPSGAWMCADGLFDIASHQAHHWQAFLATLGHPDALSEPALADVSVRRSIFDGLATEIADLLAPLSRADLFARGQKEGLPCSPVNTPEQFVADSQVIARRLVGSPAGSDGAVAIPWRWQLAEPPLISLRGSAPHLGEHNREIYLGELELNESALADLQEAGLV
jgi:crotonobetainyl-CoA:carnitine CoA-transferase CaiB-like acyl-CoA transferase